MADQKQHCVHVVGKLQRVVHRGYRKDKKQQLAKKSHAIHEKCQKMRNNISQVKPRVAKTTSWQ